LPMEVTEETTLPEGAVQEGANVEAVTKAGEEVMGTNEGGQRAPTEAGGEGAVKKAGEEGKKWKARGAESREQGKKTGKGGEGHAGTTAQNMLPGSMSSTVRKVSARRPMPTAVCSREGTPPLSLLLANACLYLSRWLSRSCMNNARIRTGGSAKQPLQPRGQASSAARHKFSKVLSIVTVNSECEC
jgi:hypothetical protein